MCGIAGFIDNNTTMDVGALEAQAHAMAEAIGHRGPDDAQVWAAHYGASGIGFGFVRLSIIDLSSSGRQPMRSASGRYVICYNGEIYNAEALRRQFGSHEPQWRGHSDTEVLLEACAQWGVAETVRRAIGMFAFALYDCELGTLYLVRDRLGQKPLYWSQQGGIFLFGSELRALRAHGAFKADLDRNALAGYVRHGYFAQPGSVYKQVRHLPPGEILTLASDGTIRQERYWSLAQVARRGRTAPFCGTRTEAVTALDQVLGEAVGARMIADVPLGAFLSGGYDSSLIVALMQSRAARPVQTFTIGFNEARFDESGHARDVARHLQTDHTELIVTAREARDVIPELPQIYDEPFADSSQIPTFLVAQLARQTVTVALSGDGGDELFAGYGRYQQALTFAQKLGHVPPPVRCAVGRMMNAVAPAYWDGLFKALPGRFQMDLPGDKIHKLARLLGEDFDGFYHRLISAWDEPSDLVLDAREPDSIANDPALAEWLPDRIARMQFRDTLHYLPGDILTKVDRASMAVGLEARAPLLDHRVVEFSWTLPASMKLHDGQGKRILRELAWRYVPRQMLERPKTGFAIPLGDWLRGPLRDWAEDLLDEKTLRQGGLFDPAPIRRRWLEHCNGTRNWQYSLWHILMFEAWRRVYCAAVPATGKAGAR